jgi:CRISPR-associated protein Csm4
MTETETDNSAPQLSRNLYRSTLRLNSLSASLWQADTVFGHLCWHLAHSQAQRLRDLLELCQANYPPILPSDGFPRDLLPRPLLPRTVTLQHLPKLERIQRQRQAKQAAQSEWLRLAEFNRMRSGQPENQPLTEAEVAQAVSTRATSKNRIDRTTNTAGSASGDLFDFVETVLPEVSIYWRIEKGWEGTVQDFLADLQASGYGKRKSVGYGQIENFTLEPFTGFDDAALQANGFVSLSRFVPAARDPVDGYWDITVKYGKLGEAKAVSGQPFKQPLLQIERGSCFFDEVRPDWVNQWYGQLVNDIAPQDRAVKQYGFAFLVPMRIERGGS